MVHWLVVTLAVWGRVAAAMEQVGDQRDLTFKIKTNDALVVFVGEKKGSQEEATFRQVAQDMAFSICIIVTLQGGVLSGGRREGGIGRVRSALTLLMVW